MATLKESSGDAITICDPDARVGREFLLEVEFEADPEPEIVTNCLDEKIDTFLATPFHFRQVEWTMQVNEGDTTDAIEAGYTEGDYTTYELEEKVGEMVAMRDEQLERVELS